MSQEFPPETRRGRFQGAAQIVRYNWPFYAGGGTALVAGTAVVSRLPKALRPVGYAGLGVGAFWWAGSVVASWYVYDFSPLYRWDWLRELLPGGPFRWANIHCGLDESSGALARIFGGEGEVVDIYDEGEMTEPSIRRARETANSTVVARAARYRALPLGDRSRDVVFLIFAAHEIRDAEGRRALFAEVRRVLRPGGRLVLVEHWRDAANFVAFWPGSMHFWPRGEWLAVAESAGLELVEERRMAGLVGVFVFGVPVG